MANRTKASRQRRQINKNRNPLSKPIKVHNNNVPRRGVVQKQYYENLLLIALTIYEWENLPYGINEMQLEKQLIATHGSALLFNDNNEYYTGDKIFLNLPFVQKTIDVYGEPSSWRAFGANGYTVDRDYTNSVPVWNNYLKKPLQLWLNDYAYQMTNVHMAIETNLKQIKTPLLVRTTKQHEQAFRTMLGDVQEGVTYVFVDKDIDTESIKVIDTQVQYLVSDLYQHLMNIWNSAMTFLGIDNTNTFKKERMITSEVEGEQGQIEVQRQIGLITRQQACDKFNDMFSDMLEQPISVKTRALNRNDIDETINSYIEQLRSEEE